MVFHQHVFLNTSRTKTDRPAGVKGESSQGPKPRQTNKGTNKGTNKTLQATKKCGDWEKWSFFFRLKAHQLVIDYQPSLKIYTHK